MNEYNQILDWIKSSNISDERVNSIQTFFAELQEKEELNNFQIKNLRDQVRINTRFLDKAIQDLEKSISQLKITNNQLSNFVKIASHDLKSPLRSISSFSGLLKKKLEGRLDDEEKEYCSFIEFNARSMSALIDDLLLFTKINSEDLNIREANVENMLNDVLSNLEHDIQKHKVKVIQKFDSQVINCDEIKFKQVLQNIISNSIKFSSVDGKIPEISFNNFEQNNQWCYSIKDNGIGIDQKFKTEIFTEFSKLNGNLYDGTGMGLSICKNIAQKHGGEIWIEDGDGCGVNIIFSISKSIDTQQNM